jgi:hypothetical protein
VEKQEPGNITNQMLVEFQYKKGNVYKMETKYFNAQGKENIRESLKCRHFMPVSVFCCRYGRVIGQLEWFIAQKVLLKETEEGWLIKVG